MVLEQLALVDGRIVRHAACSEADVTRDRRADSRQFDEFFAPFRINCKLFSDRAGRNCP
jgi:hypothetical protein